MKTKVKDEQLTTSVYCIEGIDKVTKETKLIVFRKSALESQSILLQTMIDSLSDTADTNSVNIDDININTARNIRLKEELKRVKELSEADAQEFKAIWKRPSFEDLAIIDRLSYVEDSLGSKQFDSYANMKARIKTLLVSWDIEDDGKIVPIKEALDIHPDILAAFIDELDLKLNNMNVELKKSLKP
jgi:hypothetical protein